MADRKLVVQIVGDDSQLQRTLNQSAQSVQKFGKTTGRASTVSSAGNFDSLLADVRASQAKADAILNKQDEQITRLSDQRAGIARAAAVGASFFALGRGLEGAGAALAAFNGHASTTSEALTDAGNAFQSLVTLDPAGFFNAVGGSARRSAETLDKYAQGIKDVNTEQQALKAAAAAAALGFDQQAAAIRGNIAALKAAKTATDALEFAQRKFNVATLNGKTALVQFRGAADSQGLRGGLGGAGGVAIEKATRDVGSQPIVVNVVLDGEKVGASVTRAQQKQRRRNGTQKRGPSTSPH